MAKEDKHIIDDIFRKKMSGYVPSEPSGADEWNAIRTQLDKARFYRFSFKTFNVYYAVTISICAVVTAYLLIQKFTIQDSIHKQKTTIPTDTLHPDHTSLQPSTFKRARKRAIHDGREANYGERKSVDELLPVENDQLMTIDSSAYPTPSLPVEAPKEEVEVLYLYKRDTIFQYDTVNVKKKKRKP